MAATERKQKTKARRHRRGSVLVEALMVIAGLLGLMAVLAADQRAALRQTQDRLRARRAEVAARSAVARALGVLQSADPNRVTLDDDWARLGDGGAREFALASAGGGADAGATFRLQILDAGSRVDVNTASEDQLARLPLTQEQIDSLLDWREPDTAGRPSGAKDDYYNALTEPYNAKLGRLTTLDELLLVRGWTARALYAPPDQQNVVSTAVSAQDAAGNPLPLADLLTADAGAPNVQADGSARLNLGAGGRLNAAALEQFGVTAAVAQQIAAGGPYTSFADLLAVPGVTPDAAGRLMDAVSFTNGERVEGKLNLNTAPAAALQTLPDLPPDVATAIADRQGAGGFATVGEVTTVPGVTAALLPRLADAVTVGSDTWVVRAYGASGGVGSAVEAVVGLRSGRLRVLTWQTVAGPGVPEWWGWPAEPTETVDAGATP
jgi:general secretion pathway protein K